MKLDEMKRFWDERFNNDAYAYGTKPNPFFKQSLDEFQPKGSILMPAEGEGRNAVYAAKCGLEVHAFDISVQGRKKALALADLNGVQINYTVSEIFLEAMAVQKYDHCALLYAHFPAIDQERYHKSISKCVKSGGLIILEGFRKSNMALRTKNPSIGGPRDIDMLFSASQIESEFRDFEVIILEETSEQLSAGTYHNGKADVLRFVGRKK